MVSIEEIDSLIRLKQEGPYWDFKRQWYLKGKEEDMLHDMLCMSNNLANRDAYIIIGVDEEQDYLLSDISKDPNRKNTQMIVDFLRSKNFAGDLRPIATVEQVRIDGYCLDVIVLHNSLNTPFYLTANFRKVQAGNIYTRVQDTNTPINETADNQYAETLWKKRFGLLSTPLERMKTYLSKRKDWVLAPGYDNLMYYKYAPEYTISAPFEDPERRDGYEFFFLNQTDNSPSWTIIELRYYQTLLTSFDGLFLDGGRHFSPAPLVDGIPLGKFRNWDISYRYWVKNTLDYVVHEFYYNEENMEARSSERRLLENVLVFNDEDEHQLFNWYVERNWYAKDSYGKDIREPYVDNIPNYNVDHFKGQLVTTAILQNMLKEFRKE